MPLITRRLDRIAYYAKNILRDASPQFIFRRRLHSILGTITVYDPEYLSVRLNYYNKLPIGPGIDAGMTTIGRISMRKSFYYYDLKEHAQYFPRSLRLSYEFGDVNYIPKRPALVKSRPIADKNENAVVMKLEKLRQFYF